MKNVVCFMVVFACAIVMAGSEVLFGAHYLTAMAICGFIGLVTALIGVLVAEEY